MNLWFLKAGIIGEGVKGRRVRKIEDRVGGGEERKRGCQRMEKKDHE